MNRVLFSFVFFAFSAALCGAEVLLDKVAVVVGSDYATLYEIKKEINPRAPETVTPAQLTQMKQSVVDKVVSDLLVRQELKLRSIKIEEADLDRAIASVAEQNRITVEQLRSEIVKQGITWDDYRNNILKKQLEILSLKRDIAVSSLDATETELKALYDKEFKEEPVLTASHIILKSNPQDTNNDAAVYAKIEALYEQIVSGQLTFEDAAKQNSEDASGAEGGSLGTFTSRQMVPEFSEKLMALQQGEISKPFKTRFGWHIARLDKLEKKAPPKFEEVRLQLRNMFFQINQEKSFDNWIKSKRESGRIEILF